MIKTLAIVGRFDDQGGRPSNYAQKLFAQPLFNTTLINGGTWQTLTNTLESIAKYQIIFWFADVPNDKPKLVNDIKQINPQAILVRSKTNIDQKYRFLDLVACALETKSNLLVEFTKINDLWAATILDPLGNVFLWKEINLHNVQTTLFSKTTQLTQFTRIASESCGNAIEVPNEEEFFNISQHYAEQFHDLIHGANPERFMGNLSFRCERGFPSFRREVIYISRRNVDKRQIGPKDFVAVKPLDPDHQKVQYYGHAKPSVDSPIQVRLYHYYPKVQYMLHSHAYLVAAPITNSPVPCGAIEEVDQITSLFPNHNAVNFCVNLKGHGSLVLVDSVNHLRDLNYKARVIPEIQ